MPTSAEGGLSTVGWVALVLVLMAAAVGAWLLVRGGRRRRWSARLAAAEADVAWFARDLVPQLRSAGSVDGVAGGWAVARPRVASAEDQLTVLESSAPEGQDAAQARRLRDAVRSARQKMDILSGPGAHDEWALDLDDVSGLLEVALGPPVDSAATSSRTHP